MINMDNTSVMNQIGCKNCLFYINVIPHILQKYLINALNIIIYQILSINAYAMATAEWCIVKVDKQ